MKPVLKYIVFFIISSLVAVCIVRLGGKPFGHHIKFTVNFFFGFVIILSTGKFPKKVMAAVIISLPTIIFTSLILAETSFRLYSLSAPSTLSFFFGILMGLIYTLIEKKAWAYIFVGSLLSLNIWIALVGYNMWIHRLNYGTFTGKQEVEISIAVFQYSDGRRVILDLDKKPYILEFWSTTCGVCIEQLPVIQEFFKSQNPEFDIYLVCVVYEEHDYQLAQEILRRNDITVPLLFYQDVDGDLGRKYKVTAFPTTIGINRNVIFHVGNIFSMTKRLQQK